MSKRPGTTMVFKGKAAEAVLNALSAPREPIPTHCECGRELITAANGERHCADTLEKFKVRHGYAYGTKP